MASPLEGVVLTLVARGAIGNVIGCLRRGSLTYWWVDGGSRRCSRLGLVPAGLVLKLESVAADPMAEDPSGVGTPS